MLLQHFYLGRFKLLHGTQHSCTPARASGLQQPRGMEIAALKTEYVYAQERFRFAHGGSMVVMLMARGVAHC